MTKVVLKGSVISGTSLEFELFCFHPVAVNCVEYIGFCGYTFLLHVLFGALIFIVASLLSDLE